MYGFVAMFNGQVLTSRRPHSTHVDLHHLVHVAHLVSVVDGGLLVFSPVTESAANKPAASRRSHLAAGDRGRQVGCQVSSPRLRHYSVGKLMHISLAV